MWCSQIESTSHGRLQPMFCTRFCDRIILYIWLLQGQRAASGGTPSAAAGRSPGATHLMMSARPSGSASSASGLAQKNLLDLTICSDGGANKLAAHF